MKKMKAVSGVALVALTTGLGTTTYADTPQVESPVKVTETSDKKPVSQADLDKSQMALDKSSEALSAQEKTVEKAQSDEKMAAETVANLEKEVSDTEALVDQASPEATATLEQDIAKAETDLANADKEVTEATAELTKAQEDLSSQEAVVEATNTKLEALEKTVTEAEDKVADAEKQLDPAYKTQLESDAKEKKEALEQGKATVTSAEQDLETAKEQDAKKAEEVKQLEDKTQVAKDKSDADKTALEQATATFEANQTQSDQLQKDIASLKATIAHIQEALKVDKTETVKQLEQALTVLGDAQAELRLAEQALVVAEQSEKQRQQAIAQAKSRLRSVQSKYDTALADLERLTREYEAAKPSSNVYGLTYYTQTDPALIRHVIGRSTFGATGCVPTSLAIIFTELLGRSITPLEVGYWLYNHTDDFNKGFDGTSGVGVLKAAHAYGLEATVLPSHEAIVEALQQGHLVTAAVQNNKFSPWGSDYSHQIVLTGYSNGNTYVYDPYTRSNAGWYSVANLWGEQSRDAVDTTGLGIPFVKISKPRSSQLAFEKNNAENLVQRLASDKNNLSAEVNRLLSQADELAVAKARLANRKADVVQAQRDAEVSQNRVNSLSTSQADLNNRLTQHQASLAEKEQAFATVTSRLSSAKAKKDRADVAYRRSVADYNALAERLVATKESPSSVATATSRLEEASRQLDLAEKAHQEAQDAIVRFNGSLAEKQAFLTKAKEDLKAKEADKNEAKETLKTALAQYMALKEAANKAQSKLDMSKTKKAEKTQELSRLKETLVAWANAGDKLSKTKDALTTAKEELAAKKQVLMTELATLDRLKADHKDLSAQHTKVVAAYTAYLATQKQVTMVMPAKAVQPVEMAKATVAHKPSAPTAKPLASTGATMSRSEKSLPKTGDASALASLALGSVSVLLGLSGLKRKQK